MQWILWPLETYFGEEHAGSQNIYIHLEIFYHQLRYTGTKKKGKLVPTNKQYH